MKAAKRDVVPYSQAICDLDNAIGNIRRKNQIFDTKHNPKTPKPNQSLPKALGKKKPLEVPPLEVEPVEEEENKDIGYQHNITNTGQLKINNIQLYSKERKKNRYKIFHNSVDMQYVYEQHEREKDEQMNIIRQQLGKPKKYRVLQENQIENSYYKLSAD